jgi:hypothetical protein
VSASAPSSPPLSRTSSAASSLVLETIYSRFVMVVLATKAGARALLPGASRARTAAPPAAALMADARRRPAVQGPRPRRSRRW